MEARFSAWNIYLVEIIYKYIYMYYLCKMWRATTHNMKIRETYIYVYIYSWLSCRILINFVPSNNSKNLKPRTEEMPEKGIAKKKRINKTKKYRFITKMDRNKNGSRVILNLFSLLNSNRAKKKTGRKKGQGGRALVVGQIWIVKNSSE